MGNGCVLLLWTVCFMFILVYIVLADDLCPSGWKRLVDKCYRFYNEKLDQNTASDRCRQLGGILAMPKSASINDMLAGLTGGRFSSWIGVDDRLTEGVHVFADGSPTTYTNWAPGQPKNVFHKAINEDEDCTEMSHHPFYGTWNDRPCSIPCRYNCEINATSITSTGPREDSNGKTKTDILLAIVLVSIFGALFFVLVAIWRKKILSKCCEREAVTAGNINTATTTTCTDSSGLNHSKQKQDSGSSNHGADAVLVEQETARRYPSISASRFFYR